MQSQLALEGNKNPWLFSASVDLSAFLGSAVISLLLLAVGWQIGILEGETPDWAWVSAVLLIDVAHVWATSFRVYFDPQELRRRLFLYVSVPVTGYILGVAIYSESELIFWRILALIAVFHFIRQQYGWVALYRRKLGETGRLSFLIDSSAIYLATVYPLVFWMSNLPRNFQWFVENDFFALPPLLEKILFPFYVAVMVTYFAKSFYLCIAEGFLNIGKDIVVATTAICWYVGIVLLNSDYAFTVTNVIIHGVPYFVLVYFYARWRSENAGRFYRKLSSNWIVFLATLWALAYLEELFWHRAVWHERNWLFGGNWELEDWKVYLVPLLAVPQISHYVLDGFIWRRKGNPHLNFL
ncbi:MAG: hypothetical protein D6687_05560 [Acidobacteria bacterium]|jgi:hypothetical protein|nr:MAG: hypothetical protein D6687_05560 [Acidobacteriota bacterium]GIU82739.1 MAG: hypothetical protein KatS3mg006_1803 [Pyrinomonadaceae bacterium]